MALTDVTNTLTATITSTEQTTSQVPINRSTGNPSFNSNVGEIIMYRQLSAGANPLSLAANPCFQFYVRDTDPALTVVVSWTPIGQANATVLTLYPGDQILFWQNPGGTNAGVSAITLTATAPTLCEFFIGG